MKKIRRILSVLTLISEYAYAENTMDHLNNNELIKSLIKQKIFAIQNKTDRNSFIYFSKDKFLESLKRVAKSDINLSLKEVDFAITSAITVEEIQNSKACPAEIITFDREFENNLIEITHNLNVQYSLNQGPQLEIKPDQYNAFALTVSSKFNTYSRLTNMGAMVKHSNRINLKTNPYADNWGTWYDMDDPEWTNVGWDEWLDNVTPGGKSNPLADNWGTWYDYDDPDWENFWDDWLDNVTLGGKVNPLADNWGTWYDYDDPDWENFWDDWLDNVTPGGKISGSYRVTRKVQPDPIDPNSPDSPQINPTTIPGAPTGPQPDPVDPYIKPSNGLTPNPNPDIPPGSSPWPIINPPRPTPDPIGPSVKNDIDRNNIIESYRHYRIFTKFS